MTCSPKAGSAEMQLRLLVIDDAAKRFIHDPPEEVVYPVHDLFFRAVVGRKIDPAGFRPRLCSIAFVFLQENLRIGTAKAVNALLDIADHEQVRPSVIFSGKRVQDLILNVVDVLVFVDDDLVKAFCKLPGKRRARNVPILCSFRKQVQGIVLHADEIRHVTALHLRLEAEGKRSGKRKQRLLRFFRHPDQGKAAGRLSSVTLFQILILCFISVSGSPQLLIECFIFSRRRFFLKRGLRHPLCFDGQQLLLFGKIRFQKAVYDRFITLQKREEDLLLRSLALQDLLPQAFYARADAEKCAFELPFSGKDPVLLPEKGFLFRLRLFCLFKPLLRIQGILRRFVQPEHHFADLGIRFFGRIIRDQIQKIPVVSGLVFLLHQRIHHVRLQKDKLGIVGNTDIR